MGLFGSTKIYVSSTVYNMAGDINNRPNYLKTLVIGNIVADNGNRSMTSSLVSGYLTGPGIRIRNYGLWADNGNYPAVGVVQGHLYSQLRVSPEAVATAIPRDPEQDVVFQRIEVGSADFAYWAEQWMFNNHPELVETDWSSDHDDVTGEIIVTFADTTQVRFVPSGFDRSKTYVYALYTLSRGEEEAALVPGSVIVLGEGGSYPSTVGYEIVSVESHVEDFTLSKTTNVVVSYSDGRPDETSSVTTSTADSYTYLRSEYKRNERLESETSGPDAIISRNHFLLLYRDGEVEVENTSMTTSEVIGGGVTKTTTTTIAEDKLIVTESYRQDTQEVVEKSWSEARLLIYPLGSGNAAIDELVEVDDDAGFYMPFIPVRLDNKMVDETNFPALTPQVKKAYKKLTTGKLEDDVSVPLQENEHINDIDYAYVMIGVPLNTKENASREYLFDFFKKLLLTQQIGSTDYASWASDENDYISFMEEWTTWREAQFNETNPLFGQPEPVQLSTSAVPSNEVRIQGNGSVATNYDVRISWKAMTSETGTGLARPGAKVGQVWVEYGIGDSFGAPGYNNGQIMPIDAQAVDRVNITRQLDDNNWEVIHVTGLIHRNYIYKGKYVEITGKDAISDVEESGFLVPVHFDTYAKMSIVDSTQMAMSCVYMVINTYVVKKTGFFGSTFFKILLVAVVVVITVATGGAGGFNLGILGSNAAVGAAIGLTGLAALVVGAVANILAAMLLQKLIQLGAVAIFGEKFGALIGAIVGMVAMAGATAFANGASMATVLGNLGSAQNIIGMTSSVGNGISGYIQGEAAETMKKTQKLQEDYIKRSAEISRLYAENIGTDRARLDPLSLIGDGGLMTTEGLSAFLQRTLMTGSDVAELSMSILTNFAEISLSTELN